MLEKLDCDAAREGKNRDQASKVDSWVGRCGRRATDEGRAAEQSLGGVGFMVGLAMFRLVSSPF